MPSPQSLSNKSLKNKNAVKIQAIFRGRVTRRRLSALTKAKIEDEAERLFNKANKSKAKQALIDIGRGHLKNDPESIEVMLWELWTEQSNKERKTWITKAKENLLKPSKAKSYKKENEASKQKANYKRCPNGTRRNKISGLCEKYKQV